MQGHCLCGAVTLTTPAQSHMSACHCGMCRRWGGGPLLAVHCGANVTVTGTEQVEVYRSSDWAERAFCRRCGTHLYYKLLPTNEHVLPAGLFGNQPFDFHLQIYVDHKPTSYDFANRTAMMTEAEVIAKYMPVDTQ